MIVGYVRVSTVEQNEARQMVTMDKYKVEKVFSEKVSAKDTNRIELNTMLDYVREGDTIVVHDFSRLARSTKDLLNIRSCIRKQQNTPCGREKHCNCGGRRCRSLLFHPLYLRQAAGRRYPCRTDCRYSRFYSFRSNGRHAHRQPGRTADYTTRTCHNQRAGRLPEATNRSGHYEALAMCRRSTPMHKQPSGISVSLF